MRAAPEHGAAVVRSQGGIGWLTLPGAPVGVEPAWSLLQSFVQGCEALALDPAVHVVVVQARGRDFALGLPPGRPWPQTAGPDPVAALAAIPQPVIAGLDGTVSGWGFALALACDVRIATRRAVLTATEVAAGALPTGGLTQRLPRMVGSSRAMALLLLGLRVPASDALAWGLVADVVAPSRLGATLAARARALAARGPIALRYAKEAVRRAFDLPLEDGVRLEHDLYVLLQTTADRREGIAAFRARRRPRFSAQ
jgi:enoyl-CoA hydratase